jgi:hypothetical protein
MKEIILLYGYFGTSERLRYFFKLYSHYLFQTIDFFYLNSIYKFVEND